MLARLGVTLLENDVAIAKLRKWSLRTSASANQVWAREYWEDGTMGSGKFVIKGL